MNPISPRDEMPIELLAAYADGELDEATCARVEAWLADHPEAYTDLDDQRDFSPTNHDLWVKSEPPMPSNQLWRQTYQLIENRLICPVKAAQSRRRTVWYIAPALAMAGLAAGLLLFVVGINQRLPNRVPTDSSVSVAPFESDEDEVFRIATADDVEFIQLPEDASSLIVVGRHPMADTPLVLATTPDVDIYNLGPDDQGRMPFVDMIAGPNAAMVVAQSPRR